MTKKNPLVSVIVPCFNHQYFISECIKSIINQDYKNIELIIIDDGSKDNSVAEINKLINLCNERFVRFEFVHRENRGLTSTLNEALLWCNGDFISPLASDDSIFPHKISYLVKYLMQSEESIGVFGDVEIVSADGSVIKRTNVKKGKFKFDDIFLHRQTFYTATQLIRMDNVRKIGGFDEEKKIEDWSMWLALTKENGTLDVIEGVYAKYRRHDSNMTNDAVYIMSNCLNIANDYVNNKLYNRAVSKIHLFTAPAHFLNSRKEAFLIYIKGISLYPLNFFTKNSLAFLMKFFGLKK